MRLAFAALIALVAAAPALFGETRMVRVWPEYRAAESFVRISEYFTGKENPGRQVFLRTQPENRSGYYFLTRLENDAAVPGGQFRVHVITQHSPRPVTHTFSADLPRGKKVFLIGLTGSDWNSPEENPVAWKVEVLSPDGKELASEASFLWSKPPSK